MNKLILLILITSPLLAQAGFSDFFGLFRRSDPTTTASPPVTSTATPVTTTRTTTTTESNGLCWWTQCGTRCAGGSSVHDFNGVNCNPGQYKFRCCSQ